ncbi:MAG TPA: hypothetical protein DE042_10800 [Colwellia sp.]|nr:hypothetical protein [Colwellia sp.]
MKKIFRTTLAASITLALAACGGSSSSSTPATIDIAGSIDKGSLISAKVQIFRASDTGFTTPLTTDPADVQTDENGDYTATVVNASGDAIVGALVVNITADGDTTMRCDAAVSCGDVPRGDIIPNSQVAGISLSTLTVATVDAEGNGIALDADANTLTTMATDAVLEQVAANPNLASAIDTLPIESVTTLQENASVIVGEILGVDLSETNIYDITIVDSTDTQAVADAVDAAGTNASITNTLTLINASLAGLPISSGSTLGDTINNYLDDVAVVSTTVVEAIADGADIATALLNDAAAEAQLALAEAQVEISDQATTLQQEIESDATNEGIEVVIDIVEIPTIVPEIEIDLGDIVVVTGATGGTGGTGG